MFFGCIQWQSDILVDAETPTPKRISITSKINRDLCILCQENGKGLQCPYAVKNNKASVGSGYKTLAEQLTNFSELGHMPIDVDIKQLDDGDGIEATLMRHHAGWHKTCRLKFNQTKLERLQKKTKEKLAHQLCTHVQVTVLLILKMTSASFAISQLDLKASTMHLHTTLMQKFVDV